MATLLAFDPAVFFRAPLGHITRLGLDYAGHGADWCELTLPWRADLVGDPTRGVLASGAIVALLDMACGAAIWVRRGGFVPQATLDLRVDYLRPATPGRTVTGRGECYRLTRDLAFVRGQAHDGDPADPLACATGTFAFTQRRTP